MGKGQEAGISDKALTSTNRDASGTTAQAPGFVVAVRPG